MKKTAFAILFLIAVPAFSMEWVGNLPDPDKPPKPGPITPEPPKPPVVEQELTGVLLENSDSVKEGNEWAGLVLLPGGMVAQSVTVGGKPYHRDQNHLTHNGRELWYGPNLQHFKGKVKIVASANGIIYTTTKDLGQQPPQNPNPGQAKRRERGRYVGPTNGGRETFRFTKDMKDYPKSFLVEYVGSGCQNVNVTNNNGARHPQGTASNPRPTINGGTIKQSDNPGYHMAAVANFGCRSKEAYVVY